MGADGAQGMKASTRQVVNPSGKMQQRAVYGMPELFRIGNPEAHSTDRQSSGRNSFGHAVQQGSRFVRADRRIHNGSRAFGDTYLSNAVFFLEVYTQAPSSSHILHEAPQFVDILFVRGYSRICTSNL